MHLKGMVILFLIVFTILSISPQISFAAANPDYFVHTVVSGDSLWKMASKYSVTIADITALNGINSSAILNIGQKIKIPVYDITKVIPPAEIVHTIVSGDTLWKLSQYYKVSIDSICRASGITANTSLMIGKQLKIPISAPTQVDAKPYITYEDYKVVSGDTVWSISIKFGVPMTEIAQANNLTGSMSLKIGQVLKIPVHHVPVTPTPGPQYGEYLDWWTQAQYVWKTGQDATMLDIKTGKSWNVRRTTGANHADVETLTAADTAIMKSVWGGSWSWGYRPVLIIVNGRKIAASASGYPHAGLDSEPALKVVSNLSGGYGTGTNYDYIKGNNMDGHFDIHFLNSTSHKSGEIVAEHQKNIKIAAGMN